MSIKHLKRKTNTLGCLFIFEFMVVLSKSFTFLHLVSIARTIHIYITRIVNVKSKLVLEEAVSIS